MVEPTNEMIDGEETRNISSQIDQVLSAVGIKLFIPSAEEERKVANRRTFNNRYVSSTTRSFLETTIILAKTLNFMFEKEPQKKPQTNEPLTNNVSAQPQINAGKVFDEDTLLDDVIGDDDMPKIRYTAKKYTQGKTETQIREGPFYSSRTASHATKNLLELAVILLKLVHMKGWKNPVIEMEPATSSFEIDSSGQLNCGDMKLTYEVDELLLDEVIGEHSDVTNTLYTFKEDIPETPDKRRWTQVPQQLSQREITETVLTSVIIYLFFLLYIANIYLIYEVFKKKDNTKRQKAEESRKEEVCEKITKTCSTQTCPLPTPPPIPSREPARIPPKIPPRIPIRYSPKTSLTPPRIPPRVKPNLEELERILKPIPMPVFKPAPKMVPRDIMGELMAKLPPLPPPVVMPELKKFPSLKHTYSQTPIYRDARGKEFCPVNWGPTIIKTPCRPLAPIEPASNVGELMTRAQFIDSEKFLFQTSSGT
eukprot:sb/3464265/